MGKKEAGFTLLELLVVVLIIGILAAFALIGYQAVYKNTGDAIQTTRLFQYADAQNKFRTVLGKRRYGTLTELCQQGLLTASVIAVDNQTACNQSPINGWVLAPGDESAAYLNNHFFVILEKQTSDGTRATCISDDGVLRQADTSSPDACSTSSAAVHP